jgi:hypothetical protein
MAQHKAHISPIYSVCIFCGESPLTETHIWPKWLGRVLPAKKNYVSTVDYAGPGFSTSDRERTAQTFKRDLFSRDPLLACGGCNGGWMKLFEDEVAPFLKPILVDQDHHKTLSEQEHNSLVGWLALITTLAEYANNHNPTIKKDSLMHLKTHRLPPDDFNIYVGYSAGPQWKQMLRYHNFYIAEGPAPLSRPIATDGRADCNSQFTTMGIGNLIAHVFSGPDATVKDSYSIAMESTKLSRIWPRRKSLWMRKDGPLKFPLEAKLTDHDVWILADEILRRAKAANNTFS